MKKLLKRLFEILSRRIRRFFKGHDDNNGEPPDTMYPLW